MYLYNEGGANLPASSLQYKRAVYKQPPKQFTVDFLLPQKQGNAYSYGMRITPIFGGGDRRSIISRNSDNSSGSSGSVSASTTFSLATRDTTTTSLNTEYEIWRRWEDCLYFQDLLESEYDQMSREKRARLQAGKGVKKNGLYEHEDPTRRLRRAASFESLPPGPDPNMIAKSLHELLPKLAKKGTLFKASKETVEQRAQELRALIEALLMDNEDVPTLIVELRNLRTVRDFFGFWRRDHDRLEKEMAALEKEKARARDADRLGSRGRSRSESLGSRASSIFSNSGFGTYFSGSNVSLHSPPSPSASETSTVSKSPQKSALRKHTSHATGEMGELKQSSQVSRPRAQTLNSVRHTPNTYLSPPGNNLTFVSKPLSSAPAGLGFSFDVNGDDDYNSDSANLADSLIPIPDSRMVNNLGKGVRFAPMDPKRKSTMSEETEGEPIIVSLEEGESLSFGEDTQMLVMREHEHILARVGRGVQDMTIQEEDEQEDGDEYPLSDSSGDHHQYQYQTRELSVSRRRRETDLSTLNTDSFFANRSGMFFRTPSTCTESDMSVMSDTQSQMTSGSETIDRTDTPVMVANSRAAAHAEALRLLTGGAPRRSESPDSNWLSPPSIRFSVQTTNSSVESGSGSGSSGFGARHESSDTQSSLSVRPSSLRSSIASCVDIDKYMSSSPVVLHTPLEDSEESTDDTLNRSYGHSGKEIGIVSKMDAGTRIKTRESLVSMQTVMTDYSMDNRVSSYGNSECSETSVSFQLTQPSPRSQTPVMASSQSIPPNPAPQEALNRISAVSMNESTEDGDDILDSYFFGFSNPLSGQQALRSARPSSSVHGHPQSTISYSNEPLELSSNKPRGSPLPWLQSDPSSPISPPSARASVMTTDLFPIAVSFAPLTPSAPSPSPISSSRPTNGKIYLGNTSHSPSPPSPSPSRVKTPQAPHTPTPSIRSEDTITNTSLMIKAVYGIHIIAFRVDRSAPLTEVRDKLRHKLTDQQGIPLAGDIALGYKPPPLNPGGRARSNSASSMIGSHGNLVMITTPKDWKDALKSCSPGTKLTLHVLDVYNSK